MTMTDAYLPDTLRERTRRAVQAELLDVAQGLFVQHGYEAVTVEQIATAAGMSKRSFFRYFASKDALVLGKYDRQGDAFAEALAARPVDEAPWVSLRRMFDGVVEYVSDPDRAERAAELDRVINSSETLRAGYLERMQRAQRGIVDILEARSPGAFPGVEAQALVAAAFAALSAAHAFATAQKAPLAATLDTAMGVVGTAGPTA